VPQRWARICQPGARLSVWPDKDLGVLKAFFNWCIDRGLATTNPVCKVKFFNTSNERVRYLQDDEWELYSASIDNATHAAASSRYS
jgi:site-specific recombinase XerD